MPTAPTFIVGCVRSGTTLLRDLLRNYPDLVCPEETQYYRWGHPFGTGGFHTHVLKSPLLARHRSMDGIEERAFTRHFKTATTRRDLMQRHMWLFRKVQDRKGAAWFDKSPQNVYGLPLLMHDYPNARFIHIVRNPLNVVTSLLEGVVVAAPDTVAAANWWFEAVAILNTLKPLLGKRLLEVRYEHLTTAPDEALRTIGQHMRLDPGSLPAAAGDVRPDRNRYRTVLKPEDYEIIGQICGRWADHYGYRLVPPEEERGAA